jgi:hypothetical protein|tara:strand:- start:2312 stop:3829 length:1518 start_codon:yes stop_codon:yes gene_type:complete
MAVFDLGTITTGRVSLFKVEATSSVENNVLSYTYKSGKLPPGLSVNPDGEIIGVVGDTTFQLDNNETTFDSNTFTVDKKYIFTIQATGQFGNVSGTQQFSIDVVKGSIENATNIYGTIRPDSSSLDEWQALVLNTKVFTNDTIYRANDKNFDTTIPKFLFLSGVQPTLTSSIVSLLKYNNYNFKLNLGDFELAQAKDTAGNVIYEIVYCVLTDPNQGANDSKVLSLVDLPALTVKIQTDSLEIRADESFPTPDVTQDTLFSNDVVNMQNELKDGLTINNFDYLPAWMKTPASPVRGWRLALPIRYLKPGAGEQALYRLKNEITYDPKKINAIFDRWVMDNNIGTTFDTIADLSYTGDGSTTAFTSPYDVTKPNHLMITIDGLGETGFNLVGDVRASNEFISTDSTLHTTDTSAPSTTSVVFDTAPAEGTTIVIKTKKTTFGNLVDTVFDTSATETTFDGGGTRFIGEAVTFDRKDDHQQQLYFTKSSVTDNITHVSKHRELVRTV